MMTRLPPPPPRTVPDAELLGRFVRHRDEAAFELLVWRYHRLVSDVCRRALRHAHDAEDAAQAAFLVLARRAESVRPATLPAWLARVAYRCALRVARRRRHSQPLPDISVNYSTTDVDIELDAVLNSLPEKYRVPLVLCYLHGLSYDEASARLNCPTGTLCGWLTRGKELLRKRLARRGVVVPAGVFAALSGSGELIAGPRQIETVTLAALAFAAGETHGGPTAAIATEVLHMTTLKRTAGVGLLAALSLFAAALVALADDPKKPDEPKPVAKPAEKTDAEKLQGTWLFDGYRMNTQSNLGMVWTSVVTITGNTFSITKVYDLDKPFTGKFALDSVRKAIDFTVDEFDLTPAGAPLKLPACTIPGLYKLDGDTLSVALEFDLSGKRPTDFTHAKKRDAVLTLRRAPKDFKAFPKEVTVKVTGADGKPVAGAVVCGHMHMQQSVMQLTDREGKKITVNPLTMTPEELAKTLAKLPDNLKEYLKNTVNPPAGTVIDKTTGWTYYDAQKTAADGKVTLEFEKLRFNPVIVRDAERKQMGIVSVTPLSLLAGEVAVKLLPEVRVTAQGTCTEIAKSGVKLENDAFNSYIVTAAGSRIAFVGNREGKLEYLVPPGEYVLDVYGSEAMGKKRLPITVPANQSEYAAPPVDLPATGLHKLIGRPAPELSDIAGWKGDAVKLADLKGKVVLLEFWGYWCGPCIGAMPDLFKLHDEFKDKGLAIVGVHVDADGEVTTAKQLDEKLAEYKKDIWKGRDLPFPVAMTSGKLKENDARGALADKYGIRGYPSTVLIDRDGKVVGKFHARDAEAAGAQLKKLLAEKK